MLKYGPVFRFNEHTQSHEMLGPSAATVAHDLQAAFTKDIEGKMRAGSNFTTALHECYLDLGAFGTAVMFVGQRDDGGLLFECRPLAECVIAENVDGGSPMRWIKIVSEADLPAKPGERDYEQIDCLIWHKGEPKFRVWNCEHRVWDDADGDDYFCDPLEPTHYAVVEAPDEA